MADKVMTLEQVRDSLRSHVQKIDKDYHRPVEAQYHVDSGSLDFLADQIDAAITERNALRTDAEVGARWREDSSLETWFPFTAQELARLRAEAERLREENNRIAMFAKSCIGAGAVLTADGAEMIGQIEHLRAELATVRQALNCVSQDKAQLCAELAASKAPKWQPIETAPRDGTEILLLFPEERVLGGIPLPRVRAAKWVSYPWEDKASANWNIPMWPDLRPTGWQPLPPPPGAHP